MWGEQFYSSKKKKTSSLSQRDENSRVENLLAFAFYNFNLFNRTKQGEEGENIPNVWEKRIFFSSLVQTEEPIKQNVFHPILVFFPSVKAREKVERIKCTRTGWDGGERGNVHFRGNYTEGSGQWHADTALSRVRTGARNWAMCRLARATTLYEHCGENIWFSRWPSATVKFRPHCFERRNVDRGKGEGEGREKGWFGLRAVDRRTIPASRKINDWFAL